MKKGNSPVQLKKFEVSDYNDNLLLAEKNLDAILSSVCAFQWQKELIQKFQKKYTIKGITAAGQKVSRDKNNQSQPTLITDQDEPEAATADTFASMIKYQVLPQLKECIAVKSSQNLRRQTRRLASIPTEVSARQTDTMRSSHQDAKSQGRSIKNESPIFKSVPLFRITRKEDSQNDYFEAKARKAMQVDQERAQRKIILENQNQTRQTTEMSPVNAEINQDRSWRVNTDLLKPLPLSVIEANVMKPTENKQRVKILKHLLSPDFNGQKKDKSHNSSTAKLNLSEGFIIRDEDLPLLCLNQLVEQGKGTFRIPRVKAAPELTAKIGVLNVGQSSQDFKLEPPAGVVFTGLKKTDTVGRYSPTKMLDGGSYMTQSRISGFQMSLDEYNMRKGRQSVTLNRGNDSQDLKSETSGLFSENQSHEVSKQTTQSQIKISQSPFRHRANITYHLKSSVDGSVLSKDVIKRMLLDNSYMKIEEKPFKHETSQPQMYKTIPAKITSNQNHKEFQDVRKSVQPTSTTLFSIWNTNDGEAKSQNSFTADWRKVSVQENDLTRPKKFGQSTLQTFFTSQNNLPLGMNSKVQ